MALFSLVPVMTSDTAPFGTATASSNFSTGLAYNGFASTGNGWLNNAVALPQWLQYQFPQAKVATAYSIAPWDVDNFPTRCPNAWQFQGSIDGTTWTTLDTQSGINTWVLSTTKVFTFTNTTAYTYYRLYITANGGNAYTGLRLLQILGAEPRADLLLHGDGANAGTTITDSSDYGQTITPTNVTTSTTWQKFGTSSLAFAVGTLTSGNTSVGNIDKDFSFDCWVNNTGNRTVFVSKGVNTTVNGNWGIQAFNSGGSQFPTFYCVTSTGLQSFSSSVSTNITGTPYHFALTKVGSNVAMFINGALVGILALTGTISATASPLLLGYWVASAQPASSGLYLDEVRFVYGYSGYSQLPGTPATAANLLLHMDGANAGTTFTDSGTLAATITPTATTTSTAIVPKFGTASALFNGTTSFLTVGSAAANPMNFNGLASASIDFWVYRTSATNYGSIMADGSGSTTAMLDITFESLVNGKISVRCRNGSSTDTRVDSNYIIPATTWTHVAVVWTSTTQVYLFINGAIDASGTLPAVPALTTAAMVMGKNPFSGGTGFFAGYIDEVRVVKAGTIQMITLPTAAATTADVLLHFDGANGSTTYTDSGTDALTFTQTVVSGVAGSISTAQSKFGGSSFAFGTTQSYLSSASHVAFGTADFQIDFWYRPNSVASSFNMIGNVLGTNFPTAGSWKIEQSAGVVKVSFGTFTTAGYFLAGTSASLLVAAQWNHVALTRVGNLFSLYVNGTLTDSATSSLSFSSATGTLYVGGGSATVMLGYIDELRILRGTTTLTQAPLAVPFSTSFTTPTAAYGFVGTASISAITTSGQTQETVDATGDRGNAITTGQAGNTTDGVLNWYIAMSVESGQIQSISAAIGLTINGMTETTEVHTTDAVGGLRIAMISGSTGQSHEELGGSLLMQYDMRGGTGQTKGSLGATGNTAILSATTLGQSLESTSFIGVVANPISVATSTGQSSQELNATVARLISGSISTGQSNQHVEAAMVMAFFAPSNMNTRIKTTSTMPRRVVKAIQDKKHNMGRNG